MTSLDRMSQPRWRVAAVLLSVVALLAAFFVALPVTQSLAADAQTVEVGARQVDGNGKEVTPGSGGRRLPEKLTVKEGDITQSSFTDLTGLTNPLNGACYSRTSGQYSGCIYRMTYIEGTSDDNVSRRVPVASLRVEGQGDSAKVIITPAASKYSVQENVELFVKKSELSKHVIAEFMATRDFMAINYDLSGLPQAFRNYLDFTGLGMGAASENADLNRQIVSRDGEDRTYGPVNTTVDVQYDRNYELSFALSSANNGTTTGMPAESDVKLTPTVSRDNSSTARTVQTYGMNIKAKWEYGEVTIKVTAKAKTGQLQTVSLVTGKVPADNGPADQWGVDMGGDRIDYSGVPARAGQKVGNALWDGQTKKAARTQWSAVGTSNPKTSYTWYTWFDGAANKRVSGSSNYFLSEINLNGQIISVPFPEHNFKPDLNWDKAENDQYITACGNANRNDRNSRYYLEFPDGRRLVYRSCVGYPPPPSGCGNLQRNAEFW